MVVSGQWGYHTAVTGMSHVQIAQCESERELRRLLDQPEYDFRFSCGISDPASSVTLADKSKIVKGMVLHYTILSTVAELEQLKQGMKAQQFDVLMKKQPRLLMPVFEAPEIKLTSSIITELYCRSNVVFSVQSAKRIKQEAIIEQWLKYVEELEGKHCMRRLHLVHACGCTHYLVSVPAY